MWLVLFNFSFCGAICVPLLCFLCHSLPLLQFNRSPSAPPFPQFTRSIYMPLTKFSRPNIHPLLPPFQTHFVSFPPCSKQLFAPCVQCSPSTPHSIEVTLCHPFLSLRQFPFPRSPYATPFLRELEKYFPFSKPLSSHCFTNCLCPYDPSQIWKFFLRSVSRSVSAVLISASPPMVGKE